MMFQAKRLVGILSLCVLLSLCFGVAFAFDDVDKLIEDLKSSTPTIRLEAARKLGSMGSDAAKAMPDVIKALTDITPDIRAAAAWALGRIGQKAEEAVPALVNVALKDRDSSTRINAIRSLGQIRYAADKTDPVLVAALLETLQDRNIDIRLESVSSLGLIGKGNEGAVVPVLIKCLEDKSAKVCHKAVYALGEVGPWAKDALPKLNALLVGKNIDMCVAAATVYYRIDESSADPTPVRVLIDALSNKGPDIRSFAAYGLAWMHTRAKEAIPALINALKDGFAGVRAMAAQALAYVGADANIAAPALLDAAKDKDSFVREMIARTLWMLSGDAEIIDPRFVPTLLKYMKDESPAVRANAIRAVQNANQGDRETEIISALTAALGDQDAEVRREAENALGKMTVLSKLANAIPAPGINAKPSWGAILVDENFNEGNLIGWTFYEGIWPQRNGRLLIRACAGGKALAEGTDLANFTYEADVMGWKPGTYCDAGLVFRVTQPLKGCDSYYGYYVGICSTDAVILGKANGTWQQIASQYYKIEAYTWYHLRVVTLGANIKVFIDNMTKPIINVNDSTWTHGQIGIRSYMANAAFDNILVYH